MYDLIVLGGGPAGYNAAERAAHHKLKTLLVEGRALGGVCLNEGCIPTKTLLYSAKLYDSALHGSAYGVQVAGASIDHGKVVERKDRVVKKLVGGIGSSLKRAGVEIVSARGALKGRVDGGFAVEADGKTYQGRRLLICTGSSPALPPIPGLKEALASGFAMTNREILDIKSVPKRLAVIGGGVIGLEMASYFRSVGSEVTVIEMLDHIAGPTDREISELLKKTYEEKGVRFLLNAKVTAVSDRSVSYESGGSRGETEADAVLVSIGRRPVTEGIGLETLGVTTERGAILTDACGRTSIPGVWAAGDVNGRSMLAHTAYREGEVCVSNMLGMRDAVRYESIPSVIYTNPEAASVGETSESAEEKGLEVSSITVPLQYSGRYVAENEQGNGVVKLIVGHRHRNVLGVHILGSYASEMIYGAAMMVDREMRVEDVQKAVFPHPTVGEVIREAMFMIQ